jgi:hypothetical protein
MKKVILWAAFAFGLALAPVPFSASDAHAAGWKDPGKSSVKGSSRAHRHCESKGNKRGTPAYKQCMALQGVDVK